MMLSSFFALPAAWFAVPALVGTLVFVFRLALMALAGGGHDAAAHADSGAGVGGAHDPGQAAHPHAEDTSSAGQVFKLLSTQTIAAAMMGFGWAGLASLTRSQWPMAVHVLIGMASGLLCGAAMVWMLGLLGRMKSDGTLTHERLLGAEGEVYIRVPVRGEGLGQVRVVVGDRARFVAAVTDSTPIPTRGRVLVVGTNPDNSVTVMPVE